MFLPYTPPPVIHALPYTTLFRSRSPSRRHLDLRRDRPQPVASQDLVRLSVRRSATSRLRDNAARPLPTLRDRKSTRLNSSHRTISYAVFCLKKKKTTPGRASGRT